MLRRLLCVFRIMLPVWLCWCAGPGVNHAYAQEPVRLVLQWEHQAQFAGYYMAQEQGFYAAAGLEVEIVPGGAHMDALQEVQQGKAEFCTAMLATVLASEPARNNLVLLSQVLNRSNLTLVAWKHGCSGNCLIQQPQDLQGRSISLWEAFSPAYKSFLRRYGVKADIIPQYYTLALFLRHGVDACCAMRYNEYQILQQSGVRDDEISVFDFYALGMDLPEDGLYAGARLWREHPDLCERFARASMQGWEFARLHPEQTLDVVMRRVRAAKLPVNRAHMSWMLKVMLESIFPAAAADWQVGKLAPASYANAVSILGLEQSAPEYPDFVTIGARHAADQ